MEITINLLNGDCLELMKEIPDKSIDLIICDLPYGQLAQQKLTDEHIAKIHNLTLNCNWDIKIDLAKFWQQVKRIRKADNTPCIHFCNTKFGIDLINSNPYEFKYDLVWDKGCGVSFLTANKMPMKSHEMIYIFSKNGAFYNRIDIKGDFKKWEQDYSKRTKPRSVQYGLNRTGGSPIGGDGVRCALSVIRHPKSSRRDGHPTEKPMALYKWLIERYSPLGGTVLDPTAGSFNSVFTAYELNRSAIGIEKDLEFYKKGIDRLDALAPVVTES